MNLIHIKFLVLTFIHSQSVAKAMLNFEELNSIFSGELYYNNSTKHEAQKIIYSTDASVFQERPIAVAIPKTKEDILQCILFAGKNNITLIPRAAGTSLAGQVVGKGMVVDISKYFTNIIELNVEKKWVRVQPGVIRDDLNIYLKPFGLMYAPETSTANRAMIGGMIGNNSCGLHSIVWGDARKHLLEANVILSDGTEAVFKNISATEFVEKAKQNTLEGSIYKKLNDLLSEKKNQQSILKGYPKKSLTRRNTGYALDFLLDQKISAEQTFNLCSLLAGSEGTLAYITEAKLNLIPIPPPKDALVCVHFSSLSEALHANNIILKHKPMASELVDKFIMDFTKGHPTYQYNRFFIEGEPEAMLMVEFLEADDDTLDKKTSALIEDLKKKNLGYAFPVVKGEQTKLAWDIRKAGLGLIRNMPGDTQPVNLIEDCAVSPEDLPFYIEDLQKVLRKYELTASYYAHAGAGELHVEPMINLKTKKGKEVFRNVLKETTELVKKYNGSLSGEHGDGRLRGEFISSVLGEDVYKLLEQIKNIFDPKGVFNAGKIVNTPPMNQQHRYEADKPIRKIKTVFNFDREENILHLAEKCSGSGDCRRTHLSGGTMCPSYMATRQEKDTTRARANTLRQFLTDSTKENPFDHPEIKEVMDLCLSCKACKSECPTNVDITKLKAEFLQHYYDAHGVPFRSWLIANFTKSQQLGIMAPPLYNAIVKNKLTASLIKKTIGFAVDRSLPTVGNISLRRWHEKRVGRKQSLKSDKKVHLFCDEFTNYNDVEIGKKGILLLEALGYEVMIPQHEESGRTYLSKGLVRKAQKIIIKNIEHLSKIVSEAVPLVGIEPSAILTFRDEAPDLCPEHLKNETKRLAKNSFTIEEFLLNEFKNGKISSSQFTDENRKIKLHGHCYQKTYHLVGKVKEVLSIPKNYKVETIPSGCCGMAGAFGFEKEHYETSMKVGELVLLPMVRNQPADTIIATSGTSCRHQIKDGAQKEALHPVEILWDAFIKNQ